MTTDFAATRTRFHLPPGVTYLDGNSLGPLPRSAADRLSAVAEEEWGGMLIRGWNAAGWMDQPRRIGNRIASLIGAGEGEVAVGDTLTVKVNQALSAALALRPDRRVILTDNGNFPSDIYTASELVRALGQGHKLRIVAPEEVEAAINEKVAVVMITQVDYRTGRLHDMERITAAAHAAGALTLWDLAHSAGALPVDLAGTDADFAVGCTYKYLNGGPGAPAFIWAKPDLVEEARPALAGWLGHAAPFAFDPDYTPAPGAERFRVGTPPVLQMAALEEALKIWEGVDMNDLRARSIELSEAFREGVTRNCPELTLASPADPEKRGSQLSFSHPDGYAVMQALIAKGVIGDFRAPNVLRFGFAPLYNDLADVEHAIEVLTEILVERLWDAPAYKVRAAVT